MGRFQRGGQRVLIVPETGPVKSSVGTVTVEATESVFCGLDLVENAHVAAYRQPLVVEALDAVENVRGFANRAVDGSPSSPASCRGGP